MDRPVSPFAGLDLATLLDRRAMEREGHPFLVWAPFDGDPRTWSYRRFALDVARVAGGLVALGVQPGDKVVVQLENCPEAMLVLFACARLGAVHVPIPAATSGPELAWFAAFVEAVGIVTQPNLAAQAHAHCPDAGWLVVTSGEPGNVPEVPLPRGACAFGSLFGDPPALRLPEPDADVLIMFTSGTTSRPKGVVWTHANALWGARLGALHQGVRPSDVSQLFLPLNHVVALSWTFLPALWAGATIVLQPRFSASRYWPAAIDHGTTLGSQVIFTSRVLAQQPVPHGHRIRQWTDAACAAGHAAYFGLHVMGAWGMTEMVGQGIVGDPSSPQAAGSIGRPSPGYGVHVLDDNGVAVAPGQVGNLLVRGIPGLSIFKKYYKDPQATADAFDADGLFRTGDRVLLREDGLLQFAERSKDVIKVGGEGVSPAEVERVILEVSGIREAAVVAGRHEAYGEVPVAFVVLHADVDRPAIHEHEIGNAVIAHCRATMSRFKVPAEVIVLTDLPRINFGKIAKVRLREWLRDRALGLGHEETTTTRETMP